MISYREMLMHNFISRMDDEKRSHRGERGKRFGVQSKGTVRRKTDQSLRRNEGPTVTVLHPDASWPRHELSLNKNKRWEVVEDAKQNKQIHVIEEEKKTFGRRGAGEDLRTSNIPLPKGDQGWSVVESSGSKKKKKKRDKQRQISAAQIEARTKEEEKREETWIVSRSSNKKAEHMGKDWKSKLYANEYASPNRRATMKQEFKEMIRY